MIMVKRVVYHAETERHKVNNKYSIKVQTYLTIIMLLDNMNFVSTKCHHSSQQIDVVIWLFWFCSYVGINV